MVERTGAMMTPNMAQSKTSVHIDIIDPRAGIYAALSSGGERWYTVNVAARTCGCRAGQDGFRHCHKGACKHLISARTVARGLASMSVADRARVLATVRNIRVNVAAVSLEQLSRPLARQAA
jgi:hypothetical protein